MLPSFSFVIIDYILIMLMLSVCNVENEKTQNSFLLSLNLELTDFLVSWTFWSKTEENKW